MFLAIFGEERIFPPEPGAKRDRQRVDRSFETILELAGIKEFRFHDLRHTFASWHMMNGGAGRCGDASPAGRLDTEVREPAGDSAQTTTIWEPAEHHAAAAPRIACEAQTDPLHLPVSAQS
jgi:integrase